MYHVKILSRILCVHTISYIKVTSLSRQHGRVTDVVIPPPRCNMHEAFVTFAEPAMADDARWYLDDISLFGHRLQVSLFPSLHSHPRRSPIEPDTRHGRGAAMQGGVSETDALDHRPRHALDSRPHLAARHGRDRQDESGVSDAPCRRYGSQNAAGQVGDAGLGDRHTGDDSLEHALTLEWSHDQGGAVARARGGRHSLFGTAGGGDKVMDDGRAASRRSGSDKAPSLNAVGVQEWRDLGPVEVHAESPHVAAGPSTHLGWGTWSAASTGGGMRSAGWGSLAGGERGHLKTICVEPGESGEISREGNGAGDQRVEAHNGASSLLGTTLASRVERGSAPGGMEASGLANENQMLGYGAQGAGHMTYGRDLPVPGGTMYDAGGRLAGGGMCGGALAPVHASSARFEGGAGFQSIHLSADDGQERGAEQGIVAERSARKSYDGKMVVPAGWKLVTSNSTGKVYWYNKMTGKSTWEPPPGSVYAKDHDTLCGSAELPAVGGKKRMGDELEGTGEEGEKKQLGQEAETCLPAKKRQRPIKTSEESDDDAREFLPADSQFAKRKEGLSGIRSGGQARGTRKSGILPRIPRKGEVTASSPRVGLGVVGGGARSWATSPHRPTSARSPVSLPQAPRSPLPGQKTKV